MNANNHSKKKRGFTLIEVIIAMTILSLILVLLFSTLYTANRSWESTERKITYNDELRLVSRFIQRQISQNIPLVWATKKEQRLIFEGNSDQLRFTSSLPAHRGGGGIQVVTLKTEQTDNVRNLYLYYQNTHSNESPFEENDSIKRNILLENISDLELFYYGSDEFDEEPDWRDEWQNEERLPFIISLKIYTVDESQNWPEIKIPLHVNFIKGQPQFILRESLEKSI